MSWFLLFVRHAYVTSPAFCKDVCVNTNTLMVTGKPFNNSTLHMCVCIHSWIGVQSHQGPGSLETILVMWWCPDVCIHICLRHLAPRPCCQLSLTWAGLVWRRVVSGSLYSSAGSCSSFGLNCSCLATATASWAPSKTTPSPVSAFLLLGFWAALQKKKKNIYIYIYMKC